MAEDQGILTEEEAAQERADAAKEIFGSEGTADDDSPGTPPDPKPGVEPAPEKDPWDGVDPVIREKFEAMETKLVDYDSVATRLKQAESRIGAITNEAAAKAKQDKEAPTQDEIDAAAESESDWDDLKEEFPQWAKAVDNRIKKEGETFKKLQDQIDSLESNRSTGGNEDLLKEVDSLKRLAITIKHKDWLQTVKTPEFNEFAKSSEENQRLFASQNPAEAIELLDRYADRKPPEKKTTAQIAEERKKRLKQSQTPNTASSRPTAKSDDDMDDAEFRAREARRIFAEG